ncbi:saccharopine dehydrogenase family protein [Cohnella massiliensis]|uniref:saccharopine dehydrogenase family protein n=1 Tax=Cohnella massiliensis TaxID=1816691 RepID=UPI001FE974BF|nr:saccharopine dehydrogenase NADP-binding domain-containing protein [Cohnella massiliensis]
MISKELAQAFPGRVHAAGRSRERAEALSRETEGRALPMQIDLTRSPDPSFFSETKLVVMCLDQTDTAFARECLRHGVHYIDISADYGFLSRLRPLHSLAEEGGASAVLSVGLAPGLTNLLALQANRQLDRTESIDISVMLGLGDAHGRAAVEWTVDNLNAKFAVTKQGMPAEADSFTDGYAADFGGRLGKRKAYRFNFADQHILPQTLRVPTVSTRLAFDSAPLTGLLAGLKTLGALRLLRSKTIRDGLVNRLLSVKIGEPMFAVKIDARGTKGGESARAECFLYGKREAEATAITAVRVAKSVYCDECPPGVYHIEESFELEAFRNDLAKVAKMEFRIS